MLYYYTPFILKWICQNWQVNHSQWRKKWSKVSGEGLAVTGEISQISTFSGRNKKRDLPCQLRFLISVSRYLWLQLLWHCSFFVAVIRGRNLLMLQPYWQMEALGRNEAADHTMKVGIRSLITKLKSSRKYYIRIKSKIFKLLRRHHVEV